MPSSSGGAPRLVLSPLSLLSFLLPPHASPILSGSAALAHCLRQSRVGQLPSGSSGFSARWTRHAWSILYLVGLAYYAVTIPLRIAYLSVFEDGKHAKYGDDYTTGTPRTTVSASSFFELGVEVIPFFWASCSD
jgi:hypothetical protein